MNHSNSKQDPTLLKVHTLRNVESPRINCIHNSRGFLICIPIYLYIYLYISICIFGLLAWQIFSGVFTNELLKAKEMLFCNGYCNCHVAVHQIWLQRELQLKGHHQAPTSAVGDQEMRKNLLAGPHGLNALQCGFIATFLCFGNVSLHWVALQETSTQWQLVTRRVKRQEIIANFP